MSDLHDRFETLAARGTPRGADAVLAAAGARVEAGAPEADDVDTDVRTAEVTAIGMEPSRVRRPRRHFGSGIAAVGVAATLFVGVLAVSAFLGAGGGSDSPEGAVRQLADAVSHEDPIAAADVLAPQEVQSLSRTVDAAAKRAQELELARSAAAPLAGLDLSVDNLDLTTETMADGYVKVTVTGGALSAHTDANQFSPVMQRALNSPNGHSSQTDLARLAKSLNLPTFVMTVQRDGHWYVSAAYTTLKYIREANNLPPADFGSGMRARATLGAESPEAAVSEGLQALQQSDWAKLISLAPPDEIPVYDYRAALEQLGRDTQTHFTITSRVRSSGSGDTAKVTLQASGTTNQGDWSIDGGCFKPPIPATTHLTVNLGDDWCSVPPFFYVLPYFGAQPDVARQATITTVKQDGRWFVSPVGTAIDLLDSYISHVTQRQLYTMFGVPEELPPDATLTLGTPVTIGAVGGGASVYALQGHRGDRFLGIITSPPGFEESFAEARVYAPDGSLMPNSFDLIDGKGLELPADGSYKVVVQPFGAGQTLTVWAADQAPEAAKHPTGASSYDGCSPTRNGITCSDSSSSSSGGFSSDGSTGDSSSSSVGDAPTGQCATNASGNTSCTSSSSEKCTANPDGSQSCESTSATTAPSSGASPTTSTSVPGG